MIMQCIWDTIHSLPMTLCKKSRFFSSIISVQNALNARYFQKFRLGIRQGAHKKHDFLGYMCPTSTLPPVSALQGTKKEREINFFHLYFMYITSFCTLQVWPRYIQYSQMAFTKYLGHAEYFKKDLMVQLQTLNTNDYLLKNHRFDKSQVQNRKKNVKKLFHSFELSKIQIKNPHDVF